VIPELTLENLSRIIAEKLGLDFPPGRWRDLERGLLAAAGDLGFDQKSKEYYNWLSLGSFSIDNLEIIATYLTIGETYFFRENAALQIFRDIIIPKLIEERRDKTRYLRIWCAGCCSGEEAYTIAIILKESLPDFESWNITLLATDINRKFIKKGISGKYSAWSFRDMPPHLKRKYFSPVGKDFEISREIRKMVTFSLLNLVDEVYPSLQTNTNAMDVILCRNVLMYFTPEQVKLCGNRFFQSLVREGWFITSAVELSDDYFPQYHKVNAYNTIVYQKGLRSATSINNRFSHTNEDKQQLPLPELPPEVSFQFFQESSESFIPVFKSAIIPEPDLQAESLTVKDNPAEINKQDFALNIKLLANSGKLKEAQKLCEELVKNDALNPDYYYLMAMILVERDESEQAVIMLKKALYLSPDHILAHFLLGNLEFRLEKKASAQKHYQQLLQLLKSYADADTIPDSEGMTAGTIRESIMAYK